MLIVDKPLIAKSKKVKTQNQFVLRVGSVYINNKENYLRHTLKANILNCRSLNHFICFSMQDWEGQTRYAEYGFFRVSNELNSYKLFLANYSGNAGDSLRYHNNTNFSTMNKDNDKCVDHCASMRKGTFFAKNPRKTFLLLV